MENELDPEKERQLLESARQDIAAFGSLYAHYLPRVYAYIAGRVGSKSATEDLVSETFLRVVEGLPKFEHRGGASFAGWLFRIAHNVVRDSHRKRDHAADAMSLEAIAELPSGDILPEDATLRNERFQELRRLIDGLPRRRREVVALKFLGELRNAEIAEVLGLNEKTVASHLCRAYVDLHERYSGGAAHQRRGKGGESGAKALPADTSYNLTADRDAALEPVRWMGSVRPSLRRDGDVMKRVLLTGMSGTGQSTVIGELAARGYKAVDADTNEFSEWVEVTDDSGVPGTPVEPDRDWVWREDRVQELLSTEDADVLFMSGCAANMVGFLPQFDHVVLLSAPAEVIVERLNTRTSNAYGKHPDEVARVLDLIETVEPRLRSVPGHEINTNARLDDVVASVLQLVQS